LEGPNDLKNFQEILSRDRGNFEEQSKVLESSIIKISYCIIIANYNYLYTPKRLLTINFICKNRGRPTTLRNFDSNKGKQRVCTEFIGLCLLFLFYCIVIFTHIHFVLLIKNANWIKIKANIAESPFNK
jgi:hypothetical protein